MDNGMAATPKVTGDLFPGEQHGGSSLKETARLEEPLHDTLTATDRARLAEHAHAHARSWNLAGKGSGWSRLLGKLEKAKKNLKLAYGQGRARRRAPEIPEAIREELLSSRLLVQSIIRNVGETVRGESYVPLVADSKGNLPRPYLAAKAYLSVVDYEFDANSCLAYLQSLQEVSVFDIAEIWLLMPMLQLQLVLELSAAIEASQAQAQARPEKRQPLGTLYNSLNRMRLVDWKSVFASVSITEKILCKDPVAAYGKMEFQSCESYRQAIQDLARYSNTPEQNVARHAIAMAERGLRRFPAGSRNAQRYGHVGYYLVGRGRVALERQIEYTPPSGALIRRMLLEAPELFYFLGTEFFIFGILLFLLSGIKVGIPLLAATLLFLLPASEAAIEAINQFLVFLLPPRVIPRLDFEASIPEDCATVVAVPALLISKEQVQHLVRALEIRYLGNVDPNLYFALLTDPPDSHKAFDAKDELAALCSSMIDQLNKKYAKRGSSRFYHLHRNRSFNESDNTWMGWERKRGKLLDFNEVLRGGHDRFPIKVGDLECLRRVRFVITLDSDSQLPRGSAARLIGAMAHPLNQAVIDPVTKTVKDGYGVLQPRIGISVRSVNRSRLAYIYSGETGLDIYTRAVSDIYQDLFGEGIFTGKGIYEIDVFREVLANRFPSNAILSHDLIEGVYTRAGLDSEVEIIDDYPSHFSAHSGRKHRWIRGDWQILKWMFGHVPDANGKRVRNPLSILSRWKLLDNLRRSVIETATFVLLLACWFYLPGSPTRWTFAAVALLLIPSYVQGLLTLIRHWNSEYKSGALAQGLSDFVTTQLNVLIYLTFLPHQALITLDAIIRTIFRLTVTHRNLLEWETAAQSELDNRRKTPVDRYLDFMPALAAFIATALAIFHPEALAVAGPILLLWLLSKPATKWLDRPLRSARTILTPNDERYLRHVAMKTWRFFMEFSTAEENCLIPDNVQGEEHQIAHRLSTTNLGLLFTSQLAAYQLGMLDVAHFAILAENTLASAKRLPHFHGQLVNWYDSKTLEALTPLFISSVDNGNLACCLWTLKHGAIDAMNRPIFHARFFVCIEDCLDLAIETMKIDGYSNEQVAVAKNVRTEAHRIEQEISLWCLGAPGMLASLAVAGKMPAQSTIGDAAYWLAEAQNHLRNFVWMVESFAPWLLPRFATAQPLLPNLFEQKFLKGLTAGSLPQTFEQIRNAPQKPEIADLQSEMPRCTAELEHLRSRLARLAVDSELFVTEMDFSFLYDKERKALSVGYDLAENRLQKSSYDLLASEARSAVFVGIAKNEIPQDVWFCLGRTHARYAKRNVLVSWTGTMFEYLMPTLWLKHFPATLLENSARAAVDAQRAFAASHRIPWGISEGACTAKNDAGHYEYHAFGVPQMALKANLTKRIVVTPYACALALTLCPLLALQNLLVMSDSGWLGKFGFYESAEFKSAVGSKEGRFEIVHAWMAHHQAMILMSICNLLTDSILPELFHREVRVEATEHILHERPLSLYARSMMRDEWGNHGQL
jgi:cyclic beta-1,2-glucan glucanotransferase